MTTTINRSQIFKAAWTLVKTNGITLSAALKQSWASAKNPAPNRSLVEMAEVVKNHGKELNAILAADGVAVTYWEGGDKKRLYVKELGKKDKGLYFNMDNGKSHAGINYGWVMDFIKTEFVPKGEVETVVKKSTPKTEDREYCFRAGLGFYGTYAESHRGFDGIEF